MKSKISTVILLLLLSTMIFQSNAVIAQNSSDEIAAGKKIKIFSKILNEERPIYISLPYGYDQSKKNYPVIYITDGSGNRLIGSGGMIRYFANTIMPEMISVIIPNTDRGRDLSISTTPLEQLPGSGGKGGENFLKFFTEEMIPYIDSNYRSTDYRILVGYSAGGGFVFNALLSIPDYFDAYIAASPSFFFEDEIIQKTEKFFRLHKAFNKFLFVPFFDQDLTVNTKVYPNIDKIIQDNFPNGFRYKVKLYPGMAHVPPTALFDGLTELFKNWKPVDDPKINPSKGFLKIGNPIKASLISTEAQVRYTFDGSEPTIESPLYTEPIVIDKPGTLNAKSFQGNISESDVATAEFTVSNLALPMKKIKNLNPGLTYKYFDRRWYMLPDTVNIVPTKEGIVNTITIAPKTKSEGFIFSFDGFIKIEKEGYYRFHVLSTVISKLFIGTVKLIELKRSNTKQEISGEIYLMPGYYPVRALYSNAWSNGDDFVVSYEGPGIQKQEIPAEILYHKPEN